MRDDGVAAAAEDDLVLFVSAAERSGFTAHSRIDDEIRDRVKHLRADYREVLAQIVAMVEGSEVTQTIGGLALDEVSIGLGFNANGKLGFIAGIELGANATVTVKFTRPRPVQ